MANIKNRIKVPLLWRIKNGNIVIVTEIGKCIPFMSNISSLSHPERKCNIAINCKLFIDIKFVTLYSKEISLPLIIYSGIQVQRISFSNAGKTPRLQYSKLSGNTTGVLYYTLHQTKLSKKIIIHSDTQNPKLLIPINELVNPRT